MESWSKMVKKNTYGDYYNWETRWELKRDREAGPPEDLAYGGGRQWILPKV